MTVLGKEVYALQHKKRKMIYEHISAHPGVSFNVLKRVFDLKDGTLRYHLDYLKKNDQITFNTKKGKRIYFPKKMDTLILKIEKKDLKSYVLTYSQKKMISLIKENPGINQKELSKKMDMNRFTLRNNLNKLLQLCIIRRRNKNRNVCYEYISDDEIQHEILVNLIIKFLNKEIDEETFLRLRDKIKDNK